MRTKTCTGCGERKLCSEFNARRSSKDGLHQRCRTCTRLASAAHYAENKSYYVKKARKQKDKIRALVRQLKSKPCTDCGMQYPPWVMDFDHKYDKVMPVSIMHKHRGKSEVLSEIAKCDLVCANCHRQRTHDRMTVK